VIARDETADRDGRHLRVTPSSMSADILICSGVWLNPLAAWQSIESAFPKNVNARLRVCSRRPFAPFFGTGSTPSRTRTANRNYQN